MKNVCQDVENKKKGDPTTFIIGSLQIFLRVPFLGRTSDPEDDRGRVALVAMCWLMMILVVPLFFIFHVLANILHSV